MSAAKGGRGPPPPLHATGDEAESYMLHYDDRAITIATIG
jgi:hypothetical protein